MKFATRAALAVLAFCSAISAPAKATDPQGKPAFAPAIVFDMGGRFDKSFNEGANNGAERFRADTGHNFRWFEITNEAQREQFLRRLAARNAEIIVSVGFSMAPAVEKVAKEYPNVRFTLIDGNIDLPNVQSIEFAEHEGSYLVGVLAALASKTGTVGFIGGMDIPLIRRFSCGYEQGVKATRPGMNVIVNMAGSTPAAWADPTRGSELAKSQFDRGADVIFAAAGQTGIGVLQAAADAGKLSIGVDSNQNHLFPGKVLTSMIKRVDVAAYEAFKTAKDGTWKPGHQRLGLKEQGVGWADDENNKALITPEMRAAVDKATEEINSGARTVVNYDSATGCKY